MISTPTARERRPPFPRRQTGLLHSLLPRDELLDLVPSAGVAVFGVESAASVFVVVGQQPSTSGPQFGSVGAWLVLVGHNLASLVYYRLHNVSGLILPEIFEPFG